MRLIWFARGREWGSRFLLDGGVPHPRRVYESMIAGVESQSEFVVHRDGLLAVRLPDPEGRLDRSGRLILHDFVVFPPDAALIATLDDARSRLWPLVADQYAELWSEHPTTPSNWKKDI